VASSSKEIHMITQPEAPDDQHMPHIHLPRRFYLHSAPLETWATGPQPPNIALAGLQIIVGYEWLLAGGDKLLLGGFPAQLGKLLLTLVGSGQLLGFFAAILRELVVPNAVLFGYLIEWGETLAGLGLLTAGLLALLRPLVERSLGGRSAAMYVSGLRLVENLAPIAALGAGLLGLSYFFLDGLPKPWFVPSIAFGGSIDVGLFLAAASMVLVVSQFVQRYQMKRISQKDAANTQG
jgi:thiosulfate dehydrogenase [quinone] large subunit